MRMLNTRHCGRVVAVAVLMSLCVCATVQGQPLTVTANVSFPVPAGTRVTWTAQPSAASASQSYRFWVDDGGGWIIARDWAESNSFVWIPPAEGTYSIQVWARTVGSTAQFEEYVFAGPVAIAPPLPLTVTSFSSDVSTTPSIPGGTPITWTATVEGGVGPHAYRFWADQGSGWVLLRDWSVSNSFVWVPLPGTYTLLVTVRNAGSTADFEAFRHAAPVTVTTAPPLTLTWPAIEPPAPFVEGTLTLSTVASGGIPPYEYQFWFDKWGDAAGWVLLRDWSSENAFVWTPTGGFYDVLVWARDATSRSGVGYRMRTGIQILSQTPVKATSLTSNMTFPVLAGTPVTWTLTATGGSQPYHYRFEVFDASTMPPVQTVVRDWSPVNTLVWPAGNYSLFASVRSPDGALDTLTARVTVTPLLSVSSFTAVGAFAPGGPVTLSAMASGGTSPYTFRFWADNGSGWVLIRDWDPSGTALWTPPAGRYTLLVMARNAGSSAAYDALRYLTQVSIAPLRVESFSPVPAAGGMPATAGVPTMFSATVSGGTAPYSFQFWVDEWGDEAGWVRIRDWDPASSVTWTPLAAGTYDLLVWARSGNSSSGEAYRLLTPFVVQPPPALTLSSLSADVAFPVSEGTPITWVGTAAGGIAPYSYRFWADADDGRGWILLRDWSPSNSFVWLPEPGTYTILVTARSAYSTADYDAYRFSGQVTVAEAAR